MKPPSPGGASVTLYDVAKLAGVSFKTAARVMNKEAGVRPATRERVQEAMLRLGYVPNVAARQLASRRSFLIAIVVQQPNEYTSEAQVGAMRRCRDRGYHLIVEPAPPGSEAETCERLRSLRVDGVIVMQPLGRSPAFLQALRRTALKSVLVSPEVIDPLTPSVRIDDERAGFEMTRRLLALGHRELAFIGAAGRPASDRRRAGYHAALQAAGVPPRPEYEIDGDFSFLSGARCAEALLSLTRPPTAIFAANDPMALGAMHAAAGRGLSLPRDLSVAGFDDSPSASSIWPQLTTVRQPLQSMGAAAVDLLIAKTPPTPSAALALDFEIIERGSTAPPAGFGESASR